MGQWGYAGSGMTTYHYKCFNCITEFIAVNLLYCPYCGTHLRQMGLAQHTPRDYVTAGWDTIAFRSKAGFVVKGVPSRS